MSMKLRTLDAIERAIDPLEALRQDVHSGANPDPVLDYAFSTTMAMEMPPGPVEMERMATFATWLESRDAAYECEHGSLPGDRVIECDCFKSKNRGAALTEAEAEELAKLATPNSNLDLQPPGDRRRHLAAPEVEIAVPGYDPEVAELLDELVEFVDGAITRLQSAKEILQ